MTKFRPISLVLLLLLLKIAHFNLVSALPTNDKSSKSECKIVFRSFGDSHADIGQIEVLKNIPDDQKRFFEAYSYSDHEKSMNSVGKDGLDIQNLLKYPKSIKIQPWGSERKNFYFNLKIPGVCSANYENSSPVTEKDILHFVFGELDARTKIAEMMINERRSDIFREINRLVDAYWASILKAIDQVPAKTVWISGLKPQPKRTENTNGVSLITGEFLTRWIYSLLINRKLKMYCEQYNYVFIDFIDGYSTPDGDLDMTMTDGNHNLNLWTENTKNEVAQKLIAHRNKVCH